MTLPKVIALPGDWNGCTWWRVTRPFERLAEAGHLAAVASKDDPLIADIVPLYDAVILPRLSWADHRAGERFIRALHNAGLAVWYEVDDDLYSHNISTRIKQTVEPNASLAELEQKRLDRLAAMRLCDGVTVSSQRLATIMRTLTDAPVVCIPNAIDVRWWRKTLKGARRKIKGLTIGWAGGSRPDADLVAVAEAWRRIAERYPHVTFVVMGYLPDVLAEAVPQERLRCIQWLPLEAYPLGMHEIDIACCSVADLPFNRAKTPIKVWESTLAGSAVVASPTLYGPYVSHGVDGLIASTADEWTEALALLVEDEDARKRFRRAQVRRIEKRHSLDGNLWRWPAAWSELLEHFRAEKARPKLWLPGRAA